MSEIEVGEYIRTKQGYIAKVEDIVENVIKVIMCDSDIYSDYEIAPVLIGEQMKLITKHSFNIIDLIEEGDYINGDIVNQITKNYISVGYITIGKRNIKNIRTILTHEQYEQYSYKVGDIE